MKCNSDEKKELAQLKNEINKEISSLKNISLTDKKKKNSDIISMIKHYIDMSDKMEDRRGRVRNFTLQMLSIWIAAVVLLIALYFNDNSVFPSNSFYIILVFIIIQIFFCIFTSYVYEKQSSFNYPFLWQESKEFGNTWKWFYYGSETLQRINTNPLCVSKNYNRTIQPFLESYKEFIHEYLVEDIDSEISNNIQQLHLLRAHNYYKNNFFLQLTNIQKYSLFVLLISAIISVILIVWVN